MLSNTGLACLAFLVFLIAKWGLPNSEIAIGRIGAATAVCGLLLDTFRDTTDNTVRDRIVASKLAVAVEGPLLDREADEPTLKALLYKEDGYAVLLSGNHQVGKSELVKKVLQGEPGVVHLTLRNHGVFADQALISELETNSMGQLKAALREAKRILRKRPLIVLDIPRKQKDPNVLDSVSTFAKEFGFDLQLARILVVASSAAAAASFNPDGRSREHFLQPLTKMEFDQADAFLRFHGNETALKHKNEIYELTGGHIGRAKELAGGLKDLKWEVLKAKVLDAQKQEVDDFLLIDEHRGFGQGNVKGALELACAVARADYDAGAARKQLGLKFTPRDFALAVRASSAQPIYYNVQTKSYQAASQSIYSHLQQLCGNSQPEMVNTHKWMWR